jgi:hypothetical protein
VLPFAEICALSSGLATECRITREQVRSHVPCVTPVTARKVARLVSLGKLLSNPIVRLIQKMVTRFGSVVI